jgi:hypothetical protein
MGRVERKAFIPQDQGVASAFICPVAVKHRLRMLNKPLDRRLSVVAAIILFMALLCSAFLSHAALGPQPPCGSTTFPPYPDLAKSPVVRVWDSTGSGRDWMPPICTGWTDSGFTMLVVTVARFRTTSGVEGLLRRVGAISERTGIRYWSITHKRWQTLVVKAYALSEVVGDRRRKDFSPDEIAQGGSLYFEQEDNLGGKATYRMRIRIASHDRLVFDIENISTVRYFFIPIFHPGELQSIYFFERESQDVWRYYSIVRTSKTSSPLTGGNEASAINRAVAFYRYLTGIPLDQEPPASP